MDESQIRRYAVDQDIVIINSASYMYSEVDPRMWPDVPFFSGRVGELRFVSTHVPKEFHTAVIGFEVYLETLDVRHTGQMHGVIAAMHELTHVDPPDYRKYAGMRDTMFTRLCIKHGSGWDQYHAMEQVRDHWRRLVNGLPVTIFA